jgi:predicted transcriptional regulator
MEKTTIQLSQSTIERLKTLKSYERQSYDEVLNLIIDDIEEEMLNPAEINEIQQGLEDLKKGRTQSIEAVAKELRITLN